MGRVSAFGRNGRTARAIILDWNNFLCKKAISSSRVFRHLSLVCCCWRVDMYHLRERVIIWVIIWVSEGRNQWVFRWSSVSVSEWVSEWVIEWISEFVSEWMNEWVTAWVIVWDMYPLGKWVASRIKFYKFKQHLRFIQRVVYKFDVHKTILTVIRLGYKCSI